MRFLMCVAFVLSACGKQAPIGVDSPYVATTSGQVCAEQCTHVGMTLDSIVIMAGRIGCVCRVATAAPPSTGAPGATAGGMSAILLDEAAAQASHSRSMSHH